MEQKPWYGNGLRFECTRCGNCCRNHGEYSFVNLSEVELRAIPEFLGITREEFLEDAAVADTALVLAALARRRHIDEPLPASPTLPALS